MTREEIQSKAQSDFNLFNQLDLSGMDLSGLDLSGADFRFCNMTGCNLNGCNLTNAKLRVSNLTNAILTNCLLDNITLEGSNLTNASLVGSSWNGEVIGSGTIFSSIDPVTLVLTDKFIQVGCFIGNKSFFESVTSEQISSMSPNQERASEAVGWWEANKTAVLELIGSI